MHNFLKSHALIIVILIIVATILSSCSSQNEENKPLTSDEIDRIFSENYDDFQKIVQLYYNNPQFYEWYYQEFDRYGLNSWTMKNIDPIKRRSFFSDEEWIVFEKMFFSYNVVEITMHGAEYGLQFVWTVQDQNSAWTVPHQNSEVTSIGYYYDVGKKSDKDMLMNFHTIEETTHENWLRFKSKSNEEIIREINTGD